MTTSTKVVSSAITFRSKPATHIAGITKVVFCGELESEGASVATFGSEMTSKDGCYYCDTYLEPPIQSDDCADRISEEIRSLESPISMLLVGLIQAWEETPGSPQPGLEGFKRVELN